MPDFAEQLKLAEGGVRQGVLSSDLHAPRIARAPVGKRTAGPEGQCRVTLTRTLLYLYSLESLESTLLTKVTIKELAFPSRSGYGTETVALSVNHTLAMHAVAES